jgi:transcriptional regulator with XRE-family HTH domain
MPQPPAPAVPAPPRTPAVRTEPPLRVLVGAILRGHRERQGRTLRDVAEDARVSVPYLSEVERGRKEASSEVLAAVCRALGLGLVDLVGDAHAQLARAHGRVVLDLAAAAGPAADRRDGHELATVTPLHPAPPAPGSVRLAA